MKLNVLRRISGLDFALFLGIAAFCGGSAGSAGEVAQLPPPPQLEFAYLVGEYGTGDNLLEIYESGGQLLADGHGLHAVRLTRPSGAHGPQFTLDQPTAPTITVTPSEVTLGAEHLPRRDVGAEVVATIRAGVHADVDGLRAAALAATPPVEPAPKHPADLVDLARVDPSIHLDIRYATSDNFMGIPLYDRPAAYLQRPAAEALGRAARALKAQGFGLLIHDAYRPWSVTWMFWQATPPASHVFVADPAKGSRHNRGCAVDLSLYDLATGQPVEMTGRYDEMSKRSYADYIGGTSRQRALRQILRNAMEAEGFNVYPEEWWHFDYRDWRDYGIGVATFDQLAATSR